ncbi:MAG: B12-binding domain-containing radical SAM protein [Planctomycetota bacterium]|jgi:radical SAM superfamily enzyme YgiQ (UPF0313 family)
MKSPHRIHFVHAPQVYYEQNYGTRFVPLWAYTLAAHVPERWDVAITDCTMTDRSEIPAADVFAFSGINQDFHTIRDTHRFLKKRYPDAVFLLGGPITWSFEKDGRLDELREFDHLFILDGERTLPGFLRRFEAGRRGELDPIIRAGRFPLDRARPFRSDLLEPNVSKYYGGVIEVSRGCPFLCEFCDIRVLPGNNETHVKDPDLVVEELDRLYRMGVRRVQVACDNYIGDQAWAERCTDAILKWTQETGAEMALYTWVTVNLSRLPRLMTKMRKAGFTTLFIGIESFNSQSIQETAKVQNANDRRQMGRALRRIQSFGFYIAPGFIFGFDNDPPTVFDDTLEDVIESGLISGDPTFLIGLPGTPLYSRMKRTGRLVMQDECEDALALERERVSKIESNIRFLQPRNFLVRGFMRFIRALTSADVMYRRFRRHIEITVESENFVPSHSIGYGSLPEYLKFQFSSWASIRMMLRRMFHLSRPRNLWTVLKARFLIWRHRRAHPELKNNFSLWLFFWSNLLIKYSGLREEDFNIHTVGRDFDLNALWEDVDPEEALLGTGGRNADRVKVGAQRKSTKQALDELRRNLSTAYSFPDFR